VDGTPPSSRLLPPSLPFISPLYLYTTHETETVQGLYLVLALAAEATRLLASAPTTPPLKLVCSKQSPISHQHKTVSAKFL
jgi:hypothetical protein